MLFVRCFLAFAPFTSPAPRVFAFALVFFCFAFMQAQNTNRRAGDLGAWAFVSTLFFSSSRARLAGPAFFLTPALALFALVLPFFVALVLAFVSLLLAFFSPALGLGLLHLALFATARNDLRFGTR